MVTVLSASFEKDVGIAWTLVDVDFRFLELFATLQPEKVQAIAFEIAVRGQNGLDINNTTMNYRLKELPGEFSGSS